MDWRRVRCWFTGHVVRNETAIIKEDKKYHGHTTTRKYGKCARCGKGTLENELSYWGDEKNLFERHETLWLAIVIAGSILGFCVATAVVIGLGALIAFPLSKHMCMEYASQMGLEGKYSYWTGCYLKVEGRWIANELLSVVDLLK